MRVFSFNYTILLKIRLAVLNVLQWWQILPAVLHWTLYSWISLSPFFFYSQNINTFENRMLMLDGMPAVRVKTELLESEQGVSGSFWRRPTPFSLRPWQALMSRVFWGLQNTSDFSLASAFVSWVTILRWWVILTHLQPQNFTNLKKIAS